MSTRPDRTDHSAWSRYFGDQSMDDFIALCGPVDPHAALERCCAEMPAAMGGDPPTSEERAEMHEDISRALAASRAGEEQTR